MSTVIISTQGWSGWPDFAGSTWVPMQYVLGFQQMGVDVYWVDHLPRVNPLKGAHSAEYLMHRFESTAREFGFAGNYCVVYDEGRRHFGLSRDQLEDVASRADVLLGISGKALSPASPLLSIPRRAYVDVDPGFTQIWAHQTDMGFSQYDWFFTVGLNVGRPDFTIQTQGIEWRPIVPPVALQAWPVRADERCRRFSTVADWWGSQYVRHEGEYYGSKRDEFLRLISLPKKTAARFEIALAIYQGDHKEIAELNRNGWQLRDPYMYAGDPHSYREFIQYSRGEFSVAKNGYVKSRGGWVSDRTACYLASGKPAVVQSTGFEPHLPTGEGLLTFRDQDEAVAALAAVNDDYRAHSEAARRLAEEHFDAQAILASVLRVMGAGGD